MQSQTFQGIASDGLHYEEM